MANQGAPSDKSTQKTGGALVYVIEELGDARMRADQLFRYIEEATKLIEASPNKEAILETAGHIVEGIPKAAFKLNKALQAVALGVARIDYEEIKQDLRPSKVEELEKVLQDVKIKQVRRMSAGEENSMSTSHRVSYEWSAPHLSQDMSKDANPSEIREKFKEENPSLSDEDLNKFVTNWFENKDSFQDKDDKDKTAAKAPTYESARQSLFEHLRKGGWKVVDQLKIPHVTSPDGRFRAWFKTQATYYTVVNPSIQKHDFKDARSLHVDLRQMSFADFEKEMDRVLKQDRQVNASEDKTALALSPAVQLDFETAALMLRRCSKGQQPKKNVILAVRSLATALALMGEKRAYEVLWRAAATLQQSGTWDLDQSDAEAVPTKTAAAGRGASEAELKQRAKKLTDTANSMFDLSVDVHKASDAVRELLDDSQGDILSGMYANAHLRACWDNLHTTGNSMKGAARDAEFVAMVLQGKRKLP